MSSKSKESAKTAGTSKSYELIAEALNSGEFSIIDSNKKPLAIPAELLKVIEQSVQSLSRGRSVEVVDSGLEITTQEAADYLGMSRPTLVQLLVDGKIPYTQSGEGKHRRIRISDLVDYQRIDKEQRNAALEDFFRIGQELLADPDYVEPPMEEIIRVIKEIRKENAGKRSPKNHP
jgi:excisionase family DNA binding protein